MSLSEATNFAPLIKGPVSKFSTSLISRRSSVQEKKEKFRGVDFVTRGDKRSAVVINNENSSRALTRVFSERSRDGVCIPDDGNEFDQLIKYIYSGQLPNFPSTEPGATPYFPDTTIGCRKYVNLMHRLFYLAEKFFMNDLANKIVDMVQDAEFEQCQIPHVSQIRSVYANTSKNSKLRLYCTSIIVYQFTCKLADRDRRDYIELCRTVPDFAADFMELHYKHTLQIFNYGCDPQLRSVNGGFDPCYFHTHADGEVCHLAERAGQMVGWPFG